MTQKARKRQAGWIALELPPMGNGRHRWRVRSRNGEVFVGCEDQDFSNEKAAETRAIHALRRAAEKPLPGRLEYPPGRPGRFRWQLVGDNNEVYLGCEDQDFASEGAARRAAENTLEIVRAAMEPDNDFYLKLPEAN